MVRVEITAGALDEYVRLPRTIKARMQKVLHRLQAWPEVGGAKPLSGGLAGWYRVRTGDYRIRFRLEGEILVTVQAAPSPTPAPTLTPTPTPKPEPRERQYDNESEWTAG
jgi:mRNA-degrading endonuclease RelE of RelBE toxin-antitoxin system